MDVNDHTILITILLLGGFYSVLEVLRLLLWFLFSRKTFMSWLKSRPVDCDEHTMYCPTYNFHGYVDKLTLNMKWVNRKAKEGTLGRPDRKTNKKVGKFLEERDK